MVWILSAKGLILDATSFVRIISAIIFIISDGKIKTRIFYITRIQSEREKVVNWKMRNLNLKIYQALRYFEFSATIKGISLSLKSYKSHSIEVILVGWVHNHTSTTIWGDLNEVPRGTAQMRAPIIIIFLYWDAHTVEPPFRVPCWHRLRSYVEAI